MSTTATSTKEPAAMARWLLELGRSGAPLTQTYALARVVVREAVELRPGWWNSELFGPPHQEAEVRVLVELHDGLRRLGLMRRRGRKLLTTRRGAALAADPKALTKALLDDLGGADAIETAIAETVIEQLAGGAMKLDAIEPEVRRRLTGQGWRDAAGRPLDERTVRSLVIDVLCRAEAYDIIAPSGPRYHRPAYSLTAPAAEALGVAAATSGHGTAFVFDAELTNAPGVRARVAVGAHQHLTSLHDALQQAFGWADDHLYSFWFDGRWWGDTSTEFTSPVASDGEARTADVPLVELGITRGQSVAYLFDFGDEWRVMLIVVGPDSSVTGPLPRVLHRTGTAPPHYGG